MPADYRLPNGMVVDHVNAWETQALYNEIFVGRHYLSHGIELLPDATIIDVGANIGLATLLFHQEAPGVSLVSIEPAPRPAEALRRNVARYGVPGHVIEGAIGAAAGTANLSYYPAATFASGFHVDPRYDVPTAVAFMDKVGTLSREAAERMDLARLETISCRVFTLSEVLETTGITHVGLVKIDAERAELEVLAGIRADHWAIIDQLVVETHVGAENAAAVKAEIERHGFNVTQAHELEESYAVESMLFARRFG